MKITNYVLVNLINILGTYKNIKLPQKISYAITKNIMLLSAEYEVYKTQFENLINEYREHLVKDAEGNITYNNNGIPIVDESVFEEFNEQIVDLLNIQVNVDFYYIDFDIFNYDDRNGRYDVLSANDIISLQSILCDNQTYSK